MISIVYAHEPEVKALKNMVDEAGIDDLVTWRRWRNSSDRLFTGGDPDPDLILNVGFAGRLNPQLALGAVVSAADILGAGPARRISSGAARFIPDWMQSVSLVTSDRAVLSRLEREEIYKETKADIVDMEAWFLSELSEGAGIPFAAVKLISDGADAGAAATIKVRLHDWSERLGTDVLKILCGRHEI